MQQVLTIFVSVAYYKDSFCNYLIEKTKNYPINYDLKNILKTQKPINILRTL